MSRLSIRAAVAVALLSFPALTLSLASAQPAPAPAAAPTGPPPPPGRELFTTNCASCHGADLSGGRAPSLFSDALLSARTDAALTATIRNGIADAGMPAFKDMLSEDQISQTIAYMRVQSGILKARPAFVASPEGQVLKTRSQTVSTKVIATGLEAPWGLAFLSDGRLLVTERPGRLRIIQDGKLLAEPVKNTPKVWERQDSGMLDVAVHPDHRRNGWVYLAYTDSDPSWVAPTLAPGATPPARPPSPPSMTVLVRGKINARNEWVENQEIFRAPYSLYTPSGSHYGARFLFDGKGHVFYSLGERGDTTNAQKLDNPLGKIHRINDDGSVPADNPFVNTPGAVPTIWSYGHRNPQGMALDPLTGLMWSSEHGPTGGDEINIIEKGKNYGWAVATNGIQRGVEKRSAPGMESPITYYTPVIGPSGIHFYNGNRYPGWKNNLFVAALAGQKLLRLEVKGREIVSQETVFDQFGRTRAVATGPDGLMYVLLQYPTGAGTGLSLSASTPGMVVRLDPVKP
jgi:aldose sugar dehydrogenase